MYNPFQNIAQLLTNPMFLTGVTQNQQTQGMIQQEQQQRNQMPMWQMNSNVANYPPQQYLPYMQQDTSSQHDIQSILLLSKLLQQSQQGPAQSFQQNQNAFPVQMQQQDKFQGMHAYCPKQTQNRNELKDNILPQEEKRVIFNPVIKKVEKFTTINELASMSLDDDSNNQLSEQNKKQQTENKQKYYRCSFKDCDKVFPKECNLKDHIRTHTGEKPYKCSFNGCGKSFSQHGNLKKHEKVHIGDKKFFCDYPNCGKKFSASYNLKIHYRCHTGERPYKCSFKNCNRSFYDKGNLKYHEKTMHTAESMAYPYSCEHMGCNAKFQTKKEKLSHHNEMEPDCLIERNELIKLIHRYKVLLKHIVKENSIDENQNEVISHLRNVYNEVEGKLIDTEYFKQLLGETFEDECSHLEDIKEEEKETDQASSKNE